MAKIYLQGRKQTIAQPQNNHQDRPSFLELYFWAICVFFAKRVEFLFFSTAFFKSCFLTKSRDTNFFFDWEKFCHQLPLSLFLVKKNCSENCWVKKVKNDKSKCLRLDKMNKSGKSIHASSLFRNPIDFLSVFRNRLSSKKFEFSFGQLRNGFTVIMVCMVELTNSTAIKELWTNSPQN